MKVGIISDTHFGARNDNIVFLENFLKYIENVFIPSLIENNVTTLFHLGDFVDKRKNINFYVYHQMVERFLELCRKNGIDIHLIIGNHDCYYRNRNDINAALTFKNYLKQVYIEPELIEIDGYNIFMVPWINESNEKKFLELLEKCDDDTYVFGHLEIATFRYNRVSEAREGLKGGLFSHVRQVYSGHYHMPQSKGNIMYVGSPFEINWGDEGEERGGWILDLETNEIEMVRNSYHMFKRMTLEELKSDGRLDIPFIEVIVDDISEIENNNDLIDTNIRVVVEEKRNEEVEEDVVFSDMMEILNSVVDDNNVRRILKNTYQKVLGDG